jgi:hypothetical protein
MVDDARLVQRMLFPRRISSFANSAPKKPVAPVTHKYENDELMCKYADVQIILKMCKSYANACKKSAHLHICIFAHLLKTYVLSRFFYPHRSEKDHPKNGYFTSQLGDKIEHYSVDFPDLEQKTDIAIIGVLDDRNAINNPAAL